MKKNFYLKIILIIFISFKAHANINFPDSSTVVVVSDGMLVDGLNMRAWEFKSKNKLNENIHYFTKQWQPLSDKFTHKQLKEWEVLNAVIDGVIYTAKLRSAGNDFTFGYIATSAKPDQHLSKIDKSLQDFPMPSGTTVVREIKSADGAKISSTMILDNTLSVKSNLSFYKKYFTKHSWTIDKAIYTKNLDNGVFIARNGPNNVSITFMRRKQRTFITAVREDVK
ncbi:hypothetical protein MTF64_06545 [Pseudoalteromonas sp. 2CM41L]|uniref:hypothetical protein n=1 Tax=unclassified Pseudoalteromonas TaxID=194690 RepID=UPI0020BF2A3A|nr:MULTISPECIES: hypothetical protein [unclassified Pseudoalteromonas]MCK8106531.1 hypothetical protein [Pseudoalteromonas sp. 2CM41L]MCK8136604.1 hypothetical protein [Pseudoalteromonas sp. 2CM28B]